MTRAASSYNTTASGGMVVRAPRRTDAIAGSLRRAYGENNTLPPDLAATLAKLKVVSN